MEKRDSPKRGKADRVASPMPAPGNLEIIQDFINTQHLVARTDALASPAELKDWLVDRGLLDAGTRLTKTDLGRALDVRDGIRALLLPTLGRKVDKEAMVADTVAVSRDSASDTRGLSGSQPIFES